MGLGAFPVNVTSMRRWQVIILAIFIVGLVAIGVTAMFGIPTTSDIAPGEEPEPELIHLDTGQELWPYYSSVDGDFRQSSAINLVFKNATTPDVIGLLTDDDQWQETDAELDDAGTEAFSLLEVDRGDDDNPLGWGLAVGAERFAYAEFGGEGYWLEESAQLHDGDYYGTRDHLRLYDLPGDNPAVAIQAHHEHFDWFTLRHTVTSIESAQSSVESDVMDLIGTERVTRAYHGNTAVYDSDGWVTVVAAILPLLLLMSASASTAKRSPARELLEQASDRIDIEHFTLAGAMIAIILAVRFLGIGLERYTDLHVHLIAGGLFPLMGIGIPVAAYWLGRQFEQRMDAAMSASIGLGAAILLDYLYLGVTLLPIEILLHRGGLVMAIGLLAAGGAARATDRERTKRFILGGGLLWVILVAMSLFGIL